MFGASSQCNCSRTSAGTSSGAASTALLQHCLGAKAVQTTSHTTLVLPTVTSLVIYLPPWYSQLLLFFLDIRSGQSSASHTDGTASPGQTERKDTPPIGGAQRLDQSSGGLEPTTPPWYTTVDRPPYQLHAPDRDGTQPPQPRGLQVLCTTTTGGRRV